MPSAGGRDQRMQDPMTLIAQYDKFIRQNPGHAQLADAYNNRGACWFQVGRYDSAIPDFDKALELRPAYAEAYGNRANARYKTEDYPGAIDDASKALELSPQLHSARKTRGMAYHAVKDLDKSLEDFDALIAANPTADAYNGRAAIRNDLHDFDGAIEDCNESLRIRPGYVLALMNRATAFDNAFKYDEAISDFNEILKDDKRNVQALSGRGAANLKKGEKYRALDDYSEIVKLSGSAEAYYMRGMAFHGVNDFDKAINDYSKAIGLKAGFTEAYGARADSYAMLKNYDAAINDYTTAIASDMNNARFYNNRGQLFALQNDYKRAYNDHDHAIQLDGTQGLYFLNRARDQYNLSEHEACISDCAEAMDKGYPNSEPLYYKGKSHLALGNNGVAKADLQTFAQRVVGNGTPDEIALLQDAQDELKKLE